MISADSAGGKVASTSCGGRGVSIATAISVLTTSVPRNGGSPVAIRYSTQPRLNRSQRPSRLLPCACSGAM